MPVAKFQLEDGRVARFDVPEGTTPEQAQAQIMQLVESGHLNTPPEQAAPQQIESQEQQLPSMQELLTQFEEAKAGGDFQTAERLRQEISKAQSAAIKGGLEAAGTIASSALAEPVAGLTGIVAEAIPGGRTGAEQVAATRESLTFTPESQEGQEALQGIGEALQPVGDALSSTEKFLGENTLAITGSPALASVAHTLPTAILEGIGLGFGRRSAKAATGLKGAPSKIPSPTKVKEGQVSKALVESAPQIDQLKDVSRGIYQEINDLGVTVQPKAYDRFVRKIVKTARDARVNKNRTPKAFGAAQEFVKELSRKGNKSILDVDDLRAVAQDAASSIDPADARIGMLMIDEIDNFLDVAGPNTFKGKDAAQAANVGERYKAARNLWGRARRAELIDEAFTKADRQASGFENGLRTQLRQIVNNKKRARFFTKDEIAAMDDVIKGTGESNALKLVGRLGFSEGGATNVLGGLAGTAVLGPTAPVIGQVSRKLAQRATKKGFDMVDAITRAGPNGKKITEAYLQVTPKAQRSVSELSDLLSNPDIDLSALLDSADKVVREAAEIAKGRRAFNVREAAGALIPAAQTQEN